MASPSRSEELRACLACYAAGASGRPGGGRRRPPRAYELPPGAPVRLFEAASAEVEDLMAAWLARGVDVVGLDTEWADPGGTVALLQLSCGDECLLLRPACLRPAPAGLRRLLLDPSTVKAGVGIAGDLALLEAQFGLQARGAIELQVLASEHGHLQHGNGLAAICHSVLDRLLSKELQCSEWAARLSDEQVNYAACDASVSVDILREMHRRHGASGGPLRDWCAWATDKLKPPKAKKLASSSPSAACGGGKRRSKDGIRNRGAWFSKVPLRKGPLYGGCRMLAPDGTHMANVSRSKGRWYIEKGLGRLESEEPFVFRLVSEPKGVGHAGDEYYLQVMENRCVGCGEQGGLVRFSVVPHAFRCKIPKRFKEHSSHDIVLLCKVCFKAAADAGSAYRYRVLAEAGVEDASARKCVVDAAADVARRAARALLRAELPPAARESKLAAVREYLGKERGAPLERAEVAEVAVASMRVPNEGYVSPEDLLAEALGLREDGGSSAEECERRVHAFVVGWRRVFVETVRPRFLPRGWDVQRPLDTSRLT